MIRRSIEQLVGMIRGAVPVNAEPGMRIRGVSADTRTLLPGMLYVPLKGSRFDGHDFLEEAKAKGAAAALWQKGRPLPEHPFPLLLVDDPLRAMQQLAAAYRNQISARVIGITGSNGKTTTKDMIASILGTTYKVQKTQGNQNTEIGLPLTLLGMEENAEMAVLEMGMRGRGQIAELSAIANPDVAVITLIGEAHLELLGSREEIARAKLEILSGLKEGGLLVYNGDDGLIESLLPEVDKPANLLKYRFGTSQTNDLHLTGILQEEKGLRFTVNTDLEHSYYIPLIGRHNAVNALAAIAVSKYMGVSTPDILRGLRDVRITGMRMELVSGKSGCLIINDAYNASPSSTRAAIRLLQEMNGYKRKIAVLGDMLELGPEEERFHREIGELLTPEDIQYVRTYGKLASVIARVCMRTYPPGNVKSYFDKAELARDLLSLVQPGDVVLVKGSRGMGLDEVVSRLAATP